MTGRSCAGSIPNDAMLTGVNLHPARQQARTVRYDDPQAFRDVSAPAARPAGVMLAGEAILAGQIETIIDRAADVLQLQGERIDRLSRRIFAEHSESERPQRRIAGHPAGARPHNECCRSSARAWSRSSASCSRSRRATGPARRRASPRGNPLDPARPSVRSKSMRASCRERSSSCSNPTLGLVNLEQNNIIKLFSVMAVCVHAADPDRLDVRHELQDDAGARLAFGYPIAVVMMVGGGDPAYVFFRWKRWL